MLSTAPDTRGASHTKPVTRGIVSVHLETIRIKWGECQVKEGMQLEPEKKENVIFGSLVQQIVNLSAARHGLK